MLNRMKVRQSRAGQATAASRCHASAKASASEVGSSLESCSVSARHVCSREMARPLRVQFDGRCTEAMRGTAIRRAVPGLDTAIGDSACAGSLLSYTGLFCSVGSSGGRLVVVVTKCGCVVVAPTGHTFAPPLGACRAGYPRPMAYENQNGLAGLLPQIAINAECAVENAEDVDHS